MAVVQFSVLPLGTAGTSISDYVAKVQKVLQKSGLKYELNAMGTVLEGPLAEVLAAIQQAHESAFDEGAQRVATVINIDDRRDKLGSIEGKLASVRRKLQS